MIADFDNHVVDVEVLRFYEVSAKTFLKISDNDQ